LADLFLAQNMSLLIRRGSRGRPIGRRQPRLLWSREIRFFTIATLLVAFFMFGLVQPVFRVMYEVMPGVKFFRVRRTAASRSAPSSPSDGLIWLHRWVRGCTGKPHPARHCACIAAFILAFAIWLSATTVRVMVALKPIISGFVFAAVAALVLIFASRLASALPSRRRSAYVFTTRTLPGTTRRMSQRPAAVSL